MQNISYIRPRFQEKKALSVRAVFIFAELKYRLPVLACLPVQKRVAKGVKFKP